jgi:hypothetical protein
VSMESCSISVVGKRYLPLGSPADERNG